MAGSGSNFVLDKGFKVVSTYNTSNANGVTPFRVVALAADGTVDLNATATARSIGVIMEGVDRAKVATGKVVADVRIMGIAPVYVAVATSIAIGSRVAPGAGGGVSNAAAGNIPIGVVVGLTGTVTAGDIIHVLLTPGMPAV